jgi:hypothetical protein
LDYPNHLALLHILATYSDSPILQQFYEPDVALNGNMGLVAGALPLAYMLGPELG